MTTSIIKEQIFEIIRQRYFPHEYKLVASNVDEIINLFSKLIDKELRKWEVDDLEIIALERVKREIEK